MSQEPMNQTEIAYAALRILFQNPYLFTDDKKADTLMSNWDRQSIEESIKYLSHNTGVGNVIDPYLTPDGNAWIMVSHFLSQFRLASLALQIAERYLRVCYDVQTNNGQRMNKGAPLFWISERFFELGDRIAAVGYMLLAYVEDALTKGNSTYSPAYIKLIGVYEFSPTILEKLRVYVNNQNLTSFFPEEVLVKWEQSQVKSKHRKSKKAN